MNCLKLQNIDTSSNNKRLERDARKLAPLSLSVIKRSLQVDKFELDFENFIYSLRSGIP